MSKDNRKRNVNKAPETPLNILVVGVGGQGNILAGRIISEAFAAARWDVKQSEVHGMAQRGGAVSSHVRAGAKVFSPLIAEGAADFILSFERLETLRYLDYAHRGTVVIINDLRLDPPAVAAGEMKYPEDVPARVREITKNVVPLDANGIARALGSARVANSVLVGALAARLPLKKTVWTKTCRRLVKAELLEINLKAFTAGFTLLRG